MPLFALCSSCQIPSLSPFQFWLVLTKLPLSVVFCEAPSHQSRVTFSTFDRCRPTERYLLSPEPRRTATVRSTPTATASLVGPTHVHRHCMITALKSTVSQVQRQRERARFYYLKRFNGVLWYSRIRTCWLCRPAVQWLCVRSFRGTPPLVDLAAVFPLDVSALLNWENFNI